MNDIKHTEIKRAEEFKTGLEESHYVHEKANKFRKSRNSKVNQEVRGPGDASFGSKRKDSYSKNKSYAEVKAPLAYQFMERALREIRQTAFKPGESFPGGRPAQEAEILRRAKKFGSIWSKLGNISTNASPNYSADKPSTSNRRGSGSAGGVVEVSHSKNHSEVNAGIQYLAGKYELNPILIGSIND